MVLFVFFEREYLLRHFEKNLVIGSSYYFLNSVFHLSFESAYLAVKWSGIKNNLCINLNEINIPYAKSKFIKIGTNSGFSLPKRHTFRHTK